MLAGLKRGLRLGATDLRRRAQRDGVDLRPVAQQLLDRAEMRQAGQRGIAARDRRQSHALGGSDGRDVLIPGDLAEADDGDTKRAHL